jgi:hypothetical protein
MGDTVTGKNMDNSLEDSRCPVRALEMYINGKIVGSKLLGVLIQKKRQE